MPTAPVTEPMSAEQGAVLADFARACKAAARSVGDAAKQVGKSVSTRSKTAKKD